MAKEYSKPDFICIGLQKAGTTWLYRNLQSHPDLYLTPVKEVKYLWGYGRKPQIDKSFLANLFNRFFGSIGFEWRQRYMRRRLKAHFDKSYVLSRKEILWDIKYLFSKQTVRWYTSLFDQNKISGDLDPRYARFTNEEINKIKKHLPDVKILLVLRNPIDRVWSSAKMRYKMFEKQSMDSSQHLFSTIDILLGKYPDYTEIIENWRAVFSDEKFMVLYFDELQEAPMNYFQKACKFIDIDPEKIGVDNFQKLKHKIFEGEKQQMPEGVREYIAKRSFPMISKLQKNYPSRYVEQWLVQYEEILNSTSQSK